jgi:hypothetical protein
MQAIKKSFAAFLAIMLVTLALVSCRSTAVSPSVVDPEVGQPMECGNPAMLARYDVCTKAANQRRCRAAGGSWERMGLLGTFACQCPTGQENCTCTRPDQCRSMCMGPSDSNSCENAVQGHCSAVSSVFGCHCIFNEDGQTGLICID